MEHGTIVIVRESGEAREIGREFIAESRAVPDRDEDDTPLIERVTHAAKRFHAALGTTRVERLVITEGIAHHQYGDRRWSERAQRVHLSIVNRTHRALIDRADFEIDPILTIANALARMQGEREIDRVRLAPNVAAAILPSLVGMIGIEQTPAPHDGCGAPIERTRVTSDLPPNVYRPSYRIRPVRAWHNLRAIPFGTVDASAPRAIALLAPPGNLSLRVLCVDGDDAFAATVRVTQIRAVGESETWVPYAAGALGAEMML
jgi:hypothetical protein